MFGLALETTFKSQLDIIFDKCSEQVHGSFQRMHEILVLRELL